RPASRPGAPWRRPRARRGRRGTRRGRNRRADRTGRTGRAWPPPPSTARPATARAVTSSSRRIRTGRSRARRGQWHAMSVGYVRSWPPDEPSGQSVPRSAWPALLAPAPPAHGQSPEPAPGDRQPEGPSEQLDSNRDQEETRHRQDQGGNGPLETLERPDATVKQAEGSGAAVAEARCVEGRGWLGAGASRRPRPRGRTRGPAAR